MGVILQWLGWRGIVGIAVAAVLGTMLLIQGGHLKAAHAETTKWHAAYVGEKAAHLQTQTNYLNAALKAQREDAANKARAEAEQRANVERTKADYEDRIARARADAQRLRDQLKAGANSGSATTAPMPDHRGTGPAATPAPTDHGLSIDERLIATEQAIQLDALIDYVNGLLKVDMNGRQQTAR